jgi:hypothetical protein
MASPSHRFLNLLYLPIIRLGLDINPPKSIYSASIITLGEARKSESTTITASATRAMVVAVPTPTPPEGSWMLEPEHKVAWDYLNAAINDKRSRPPVRIR